MCVVFVISNSPIFFCNTRDSQSFCDTIYDFYYFHIPPYLFVASLLSSFFSPPPLSISSSPLPSSRLWLKEKAPRLQLAAPPRPAQMFPYKVHTHTHMQIHPHLLCHHWKKKLGLQSCTPPPAAISCLTAFLNWNAWGFFCNVLTEATVNIR